MATATMSIVTTDITSQHVIAPSSPTTVSVSTVATKVSTKGTSTPPRHAHAHGNGRPKVSSQTLPSSLPSSLLSSNNRRTTPSITRHTAQRRKELSFDLWKPSNTPNIPTSSSSSSLPTKPPMSPSSPSTPTSSLASPSVSSISSSLSSSPQPTNVVFLPADPRLTSPSPSIPPSTTPLPLTSGITTRARAPSTPLIGRVGGRPTPLPLSSSATTRARSSTVAGTTSRNGTSSIRGGSVGRGGHTRNSSTSTAGQKRPPVRVVGHHRTSSGSSTSITSISGASRRSSSASRTSSSNGSDAFLSPPAAPLPLDTPSPLPSNHTRNESSTIASAPSSQAVSEAIINGSGEAIMVDTLRADNSPMVAPALTPTTSTSTQTNVPPIQTSMSYETIGGNGMGGTSGTGRPRSSRNSSISGAMSPTGANVTRPVVNITSHGNITIHVPGYCSLHSSLPSLSYS
jgi:hypothetical protein